MAQCLCSAGAVWRAVAAAGRRRALPAPAATVLMPGGRRLAVLVEEARQAADLKLANRGGSSRAPRRVAFVQAARARDRNRRRAGPALRSRPATNSPGALDVHELAHAAVEHRRCGHGEHECRLPASALARRAGICVERHLADRALARLPVAAPAGASGRSTCPRRPSARACPFGEQARRGSSR